MRCGGPRPWWSAGISVEGARAATAGEGLGEMGPRLLVDLTPAMCVTVASVLALRPGGPDGVCQMKLLRRAPV